MRVRRTKLGSDSATQHRAAAGFALAFASATITTLAAVLALDLSSLRLRPAFHLEMLKDSTWPARWLPGAVTAAQQQRAAADQWLHVILMFAMLTLAVACINAVIGLLAHANERRYETAVRGIVGAAPRQLRGELRRNALVNGAIGVVAGVPAGVITALVIRARWGLQGAATTTATWVLLGLCITLSVAFIAARISARRLKRQGWLGDALAPASRSIPGWGADDLRALLTATQLACAVALTTVSLLAWGSASSLTRTAQRSTTPSTTAVIQVARVALPDRLTEEERRLAYARINSLLARRGTVEAATIATPGVLLGIGKIDKVISECGHCARANMFTPLFAVETQNHVIGPGFFAAVGIAPSRGREFQGNEDDARAVVVNDTFARIAFQGQDPIGKRIMVGGFGGDWYRVIGTVPDLPVVGLQSFEPDPLLGAPVDAAAAPAVYFSTRAFAPATFDVVVRGRTPIAVAGFNFEPLPAILKRAAAPQTSFARVVALLGMLLCGAAAIGTFTATMLSVKARRAEIAIRRVVGARGRDIWLLIFRSTARTIAKGVITGLIVSVALSRVLALFVADMPAFDPRITAIVSVIFATVACASALPPLCDALRISPARGSEA